MGIIFLIIPIIILIAVLLNLREAEKLPKQTIIAFTGTLGSGKTYIAVGKAVSAYNNQKTKNMLYKFLKHIPFVKSLCDSWKHPATLYSNIPILLNKKKNLYCKPLLRGHLVEWDKPDSKYKLPEKCVVLIDEVGGVASQWDYDSPLVLEQFAILVRFFRHFTDGKLFLTDQIATGIVKQIRSRVGVIYNLHDFRRWWCIMPFYKVRTNPLLLVEDEAQSNIKTNIDYSEQPFFFGFLPYKFMKRKRYESRCYKPLYHEEAVREVQEWTDLYTTYFIDLTVDYNTSKDYKKDRQKYREWLFSRIPESVIPALDDINSSVEGKPDNPIKTPSEPPEQAVS